MIGLAEVTALTHGEAVKNSVIVRTRLAPSLPRIQGDRIQLQQVLLNLIVNAIQSISGLADANGEVQISTENAGSEGLLIGVRDTGPGLLPETLQHLFEPFYTTKPDGMGMDLSICRAIIEAHGGRLWATKSKPQGLCFSLRSPSTEKEDRADVLLAQVRSGGVNCMTEV